MSKYFYGNLDRSFKISLKNSNELWRYELNIDQTSMKWKISTKWNAQGIISIRTFACKFFYKLLTKITIFFVSLRVSVFRKATDLKHATLPKMSPFSNFQEILIKFQNIYVALGGWIRIQTLICLFGSFFAMIKPFFPQFYFQFSHNPIE